jgi:hypothetical protein
MDKKERKKNPSEAKHPGLLISNYNDTTNPNLHF